MYELIQVGKQTYYIAGYAKMGLYWTEEGVYLIDSGFGEEAGVAVYEHILRHYNWTLLGIINTHIHADHIGGNHFLQTKTGCRIFSTKMEQSLAQYRVLEYSFLCGGYPCQEIRENFLPACASTPTDLIEDGLPAGLTAIPLGGHYFHMMGIKTDDDIYFLADAILGEDFMDRYPFFFLYDLQKQLETFVQLEALSGQLFIPAHAEAQTDIRPLIQANRKRIFANIATILELCRTEICFDDLLQGIFSRYKIPMNFGQHVLIGSTLRSYLSYLYDTQQLTAFFRENKMYWQVK